MTRFDQARLAALAVPVALMAGALAFQFIGGLAPCEMCHWQRWPLYEAIVVALLAFVVPQSARRPLVWLAALSILISGLIGGFHAGVEYGWWEGLTRCAVLGGTSMADIMRAPLVRCDEAAWSLFGISLAGFNFLISTGATLFIASRLLGERR